MDKSELNPDSGLPAEAHAASAAVGPVLTIGGRDVEFPARPLLGIAPATQMNRFDLVYRLLSGDDDDLLEHLILHMTEVDLMELMGRWGVDVGEFGASDL